MDLDLGPEIARFRAELRDWIAAEAPDGLAELADWNIAVTAGGYRREQLAVAAAHPAHAEWERKLAAARLICPQWPEEYGGQGMDAVRLAVLNEEFHRAGLPRVHRGMGESLVGPSVIVHGTPEQRARWNSSYSTASRTASMPWPPYSSGHCGQISRAAASLRSHCA